MGKWTRRAFISAGIAAGGVVVFGVAIRRGDRRSQVAGLLGKRDDTLFDVWLRISPDNTMTIVVPHAEMGQGVHTTLAMMLADELDANWSNVHIVEAPANKEYANYALARGYMAGDVEFPAWLIDSVNGFFFRASRVMALQITGGSMSVRRTGQLAMRVAGAATRQVLLEAAADTWNVAIDELSAHDSVIEHPASGRQASYAELAPAAAKRTLPVTPTLKSRDDWRLMGKSPRRRDIPAKVDGSATFGIDTQLPGMRYAAIAASPVFGGTVNTFDEGAARAMPGVQNVVNLGDAVAVIADGYWQARMALNKLAIRFDNHDNDNRELGDIYSQFAAALDASAAKDDAQTDVRKGNAESMLAGKASTVSKTVAAEYRVPFLAHSTMEPMNCTAWVHDGRCELWLGAQNPLGFADAVGKAIDIDIDNIEVHNQYLGGGFGRRAYPDVAVQAARIAKTVSYPVKLVWSREEDTRHDFYRQASISRFRAALDANGRPVAWHNHYVNKHDPEEAPHIPYAIDNQSILYSASPTPVPWGYWRSVDHSLHAFFTESFIDELAVASGRDSYQFRRELLAHAPRHLAVLDTAAAKAGWGNALAPNFGRGIALHKSFGTIVAQVVDVEIVDGLALARRVVCAVDAGNAIHFDGLVAQMESGIVFGLTAALYGEISIHRGAVAQSNFDNYRMLRMNECPVIETYVINSNAELGGGGEPGTPPIAPAMTNAIFAATGVRIRNLPIQHYDLSKHSEHEQDKVESAA